MNFWKAKILSATDYWPSYSPLAHEIASLSWGQPLAGRQYEANRYRYGFNGKENDNEWSGVVGAVQDYGFRIYDSRICRFKSSDPIAKDYPMLTTYQFASNMPIKCIDLDGLEGRVAGVAYDKINTYHSAALQNASSKLINAWNNSVKLEFGEASIKIALGQGYAVASGKGIATDKYGTTFFEYQKNGSIDPARGREALAGVDIGVSASFVLDFNSGSFAESMAKLPTTSVSLTPLVGGSVIAGEGRIGGSVNLGLGVSHGSVDVDITESYSVSKSDLGKINALKKKHNTMGYDISRDSFLQLKSKTGDINTGIKMNPGKLKNSFESESYQNNRKEDM